MTVPIVKLRTEAGTVWESEEKRFVQLGDHHWCGTNNEPEPVDDSTIEHVCRIWKVSEDQGWRPPEPPAPESQNPIDQLIQRVQLTGGDLEGANIPVLAMLYQARALEKIADILTAIQNRGGSTPVQTESGGSGAVASVRADVIVTGSGFTRPIVNGDHAEPTGFEPGAAKGWLSVHRFQGADSMIFCTQCGGGRLHPIHQTG